MKNHILKLIEAVWETPVARQWREDQTARVIELQKGTRRARQDKDGNPVPYWGISGFNDSFEYTVAVSGFAGFTIKVRCLLTNEELDLSHLTVPMDLPPADVVFKVLMAKSAQIKGEMDPPR